MKSATLPSLRVDPALREAAEAVLREGESLSNFVEQSVREQVQKRRLHDEFMARGLASRDQARRSGEYVSAAVVLKGLDARLARAKKKPA